jgi:hypothetical protein
VASQPKFNDCILRSNRGDIDAGGALIAEKSSPVFNRTHFVENTAVRFGGGINVQDIATPSIVDWYVLQVSVAFSLALSAVAL